MSLIKYEVLEIRYGRGIYKLAYPVSIKIEKILTEKGAY